MVERADKFENGYVGVCGWWFNVPGVIIVWGCVPADVGTLYTDKNR